MKVTVEMENLNSLIEAAVKKITEEALDDYVAQEVKNSLARNFGKIIEEEVTAKMREYITTYLESYLITVGGGLCGDDIQQYTPREYINKIINDTFRDKKLTTYTESSYGGRNKKEVTFEDFIKEALNPTAEIQRHMKKLAEDVKREVNSLLKSEYDKSLQNALSGVIMDVIMENEAFKSVNSSIKRLSE